MPGASRLGDQSQAPSDSHGCKSCAHSVVGPAVSGSPDVMVNNKPGLRLGDNGIHSSCCGANTWQTVAGSATVFINGRPAVRLGDATQHCGGPGTLIEGSADVLIGDMGSSPSAIEPATSSVVGDRHVFSHVFDIGSMLHKDPDLEGASYQIWTKEADPQLLAVGTIDEIGRTVRLFINESKELEFIVGENEWLSVHDDEPSDIGESDVDEGNADQDETDNIP